MYNSILIHYAELSLKGKNRPFFENKLIQNINSSLKLPIEKHYGRLTIKLNNSNIKDLESKLKCIPGISNFSFCISTNLNLNDIKKSLLALIKNKKTFRITTIRSNKNFPYSSQKLNELLGDFVLKNSSMKVKLKNPSINFYIEITEKNAFIYTKKIPGLNGLPVSTSGKLISLFSGGIDSPVASFKMMLRGCKIIFVHFHNYSNNKEAKDKIVKLVKILSSYQQDSKLYIIPFLEIQKEVIKKIPSKYRMIVYRRLMFKISEFILKKENCLGFVTGDSLSQVASQTISNLNTIYKSTNYPIFNPLLGYNKEEIIRIAQDINTYDLSIIPYNDCCSFFISKHPAIKSNLNLIEKLESSLKIDFKKLLKKSEKIKV